MYGKTLDDFPERFDEFLEEFERTNPEVLDLAFKAARGTCTEFPTPADVRKHVQPIAVRVMQERESAQIAAWPSKEQIASGEAVPVRQLTESPQFQSLVKKVSR